ncbi:MAG TPA: redoxin domain-containing protein [Anaerolineales bacterium]|nr:redoxin domain-containing protein [Anaerolineales bacterium]
MRIFDQVSKITLPDLFDGNLSLTEFIGKPLLLVFWSAECPQSERADQELEKNKQSWHDSVKIVRIASNRNESLGMLREIADLRRLKPILWDKDQKAADLMDAKTTPHCFLFDKKGCLEYQGAFDDLTFRRREASQLFVVDAINAILDGKTPEITETQPYGCTIVRY